MAETSNPPAANPGPMPTTERETLDYRPVSGWAIASLVVAGVYVLVVGVGGVIALYTWKPFLLPLWTLLLPAVGLGLALWAQYLIGRSEGTQAGAGLARTSWWTCLLLGVVYLSFYAATAIAVRFQADQCVREWFELVRAGKTNEAFLRTRSPAERLGVSPEDEAMLRARFDLAATGKDGQGPLSVFRSSELIHLIQQGGADSRLEGLGVQEWKFDEGGYEVARLYQVRTPEGELEVTIITKSAESKTGVYEGRQWHVYWNQMKVLDVRPTPFGEKMAGLRGDAFRFLLEWQGKFLTGTPESLQSAYLDTQPVADRDNKAKIAAFQEGKGELKGILDRDSVRADTQDWQAAATTLVDGFFRPRTDEQFQVIVLRMLPRGGRPRELRDGRVRFTFDAQLHFHTAKSAFNRADMSLTVESEPGAMEEGRSKHWRLVRLDLSQAQELKPLAAP